MRQAQPDSNRRSPPVPAYRLYAVLAALDGIWRIKDIRAYTHEHAAELYHATQPSKTVLGVGLLGGSGHPIRWTPDVSRETWPPRTS